jgi:hypothetical protein
MMRTRGTTTPTTMGMVLVLLLDFAAPSVGEGAVVVGVGLIEEGRDGPEVSEESPSTAPLGGVELVVRMVAVIVEERLELKVTDEVGSGDVVRVLGLGAPVWDGDSWGGELPGDAGPVLVVVTVATTVLASGVITGRGNLLNLVAKNALPVDNHQSLTS